MRSTKQLEEIDARIESLQDTLKMEQDRYIKQFTALESVDRTDEQSEQLAFHSLAAVINGMVKKG